ncbi:Cell cycle checkpoint protein rad17 [Mortierella claussenii]|nr:Cell cycle checkpoint protein rad17 [Mortierella claussenii]
MPPKRARAPSRDAKARAVASTALMYKESETYLEASSEESSDQISDPEDIVSESDAQETDYDEDHDDQDSDLSEELIKTRSGRVQRSTAATIAKVKAEATKKASAAEKGKGHAQRATTARTSSAAAKGSKASLRKEPLPMKPVSPPIPSSSATPGLRRRAGNPKFIPLGSSPASSSSSASTPKPTPSPGQPTGRGKSSSTVILSSDQHEDQWADKYTPMSIDQVAVHSGKIGNVREWLKTYTDSKNRQQDTSGGAILVLSGPSGSGKTTVLRMLAKEMGLNIVEWINSVNENNVIQRAVIPGQDRWRSSSVDEEYIPVMNAFQEFFSRAQRFNPLMTSKGSSERVPGSVAEVLSGSGRRNIILIEDLPPISAYSSRKIFQDTITRFANSRSNSTSILVIIVSDVFTKQSTELLFSNSNENRDPALTIRTLLPSSVLDRIDSGSKGNARIKQIKFNPIAPTIMKKALRKLIDQEFRTSHAYAPDTAELDLITEIHEGDIRAAINALQFLCYIPSKKRKRYRDITLRLEEEQLHDSNKLMLHSSENKAAIGQDSSLGVFHAVAKVLYNRRDWTEPRVQFDSDLVKVPAQSFHKARPPLRFNPEKELIEKLPVEPDLYTLMLHQNYTRHMNTIEECQTAIEYLCLADQFSASSGSTAGYTQMIQMQPYVTSLSVRGLLFAPASAGPTSASSGSSGQKKHWWPELFAVNRTMRVNDQLFTDVAADLAGDEARGLSSGHVAGPGVLPKRVVREELVPMLHKCATANPYMPIFNKSLRPSSKTFVRTGAANFGKKIGLVKKEFGEGDEGFTEEISSSAPTGEDTDPSGASGSQSATPTSNQQREKQNWQQQPHALAQATQRDDDPIEDFSD